MAIDPITAKLLARAVIKTTADKGTRRKALCIILASIIIVLVVIALFLYLISNPLSLLSAWLKGNESFAVESLQKNYGYNQAIGIYDHDYVESSGQNYEGIVFSDGETEVVYFNQLDERWANKPYGTDNIGGYACGPTSMSIVISSLTGQIIDPPTVAEWAYQNGYWCSGNGSYHSLIPGAARAYGLQVEGATASEGQKIVDALASGKLVVAIMGKGHFTTSGHFMVLRGVTSDGKILVADPASKKRSEQEWDLSIILDEARKGAGAGGPFWICGLPLNGRI